MQTAWEAAYDQGQERYGPLELSRADAEARLREHLARRLEPLGLAPLDSTLDDLLARSAGADLVLAVAVEAAVPGAAGRVRERVAPAVKELARKRGVVTGLAERYVADVIEQALEMPPSGLTRTRLAAYDGSASLASWLALGVEERVQEAARQPAPGQAAPPPAPPAAPHEHPSANLLAGLSEGRLLVAEAAAVVQHASRCARCLELLKGLELAGLKPVEEAALPGDPSLSQAPVRSRARPGQPRKRLGGLALGIAVVLGVVGLALSQGGRSLFDAVARTEDTEREVFETAARLRSQEPGLFGDFEPYLRAELERGTAKPAVEEEGPRPVHPRERVLSPTPTFQWRDVADATGYVVTLYADDGAVLWTGTVETPTLAWPTGLAPLAPGSTAAWEVGLAAVEGRPLRARFSVAPERDAVHWQRRVARLEELVSDADVRAVFAAQVALRRGHLWEAWETIRAHTRRAPRDRYGGALEGYLRRVHGFRD